MKLKRSIAFFLFCFGLGTQAWAQEVVHFESRDLTASGAPVRLSGLWFAPRDPARQVGAMIGLHGCGGLWSSSASSTESARQMSQRHAQMAALLVREGYAVLMLDSFTTRDRPRGICAEKIGQRSITQTNRRRDLLAALDWVAARPGVARSKIGVLGWSHGGSAVLAGSDAAHAEVAQFVAQGGAKPAVAVAFYPGCSAAVKDGYRPVAPTQIHIGEKDDWTPPGPCVALSERLRTQMPGLETFLYADSYHDFDSPNTSLRVRSEVPNGINPGKGVTVGSNPVARELAYRRVTQFLAQHLR